MPTKEDLTNRIELLESMYRKVWQDFGKATEDLRLERSMHAETKHALKRAIAFGQSQTRELEDAQRKQGVTNRGVDQHATDGS